MIIYFLSAEEAEKAFLMRDLAAHELRFMDRFDESHEEAEVLSVFMDRQVNAEFLECHPRLRLIATRSHSVEHVDMTACRARGVAVASVPAYGEITVAEHTFALILALSRRLREIMTLPKTGRFSYEATRGFDLAGKTLGIIGVGRIGRRVARLARGFEMEVIACDPGQELLHPQPEEHFRFVPLQQVLAQSHVISLHASLTPATFHLIDTDSLAQCRPGVLLINTARGALVNTSALREALDSGQVGGAGLDVLQDERVMRESPSRIISKEIVRRLRSDAMADEDRDADRLRQMQELMLGDAILARANVVFTPHVAFNSIEAIEHLCQVTAANIEAFLCGSPRNLA